MKEYLAPEAEIVSFETEQVTSMDLTSGDGVAGISL